MATTQRRLVIGISGASGVAYGIRALEVLRGSGIETHLVMTRSAELTLAYETNLKLRDVHALASVVHKAEDVGASIASGSFRTLGMLVAPCSIRTLSEVAYGQTTSLLFLTQAERRVAFAHIDHVLTTTEIVARSVRNGRGDGSDHVPMMVDLALVGER